MADSQPDAQELDDLYRATSAKQPLLSDPRALVENMRSEYELLAKTIAEFDGRALTIKGWSVTLALAALGLGFQQSHYALFGLAALSAIGFATIDALTKTYQLRFYSRMRDIEVAAFHLNRVDLPTGLGQFSSPRIDEAWGYRGEEPDWRGRPPWRRDPAEIRTRLRRVWYSPSVLLPHAIAIVVGTVLFLLAAADVGPLAQLGL